MSVCVANTISELCGNYIAKRIGTKKTFIYSYCISIFATSLIYLC